MVKVDSECCLLETSPKKKWLLFANGVIHQISVLLLYVWPLRLLTSYIDLPKTPSQKHNSSSQPYLTTVYITFQESKNRCSVAIWSQIPFEGGFCLSFNHLKISPGLFLTDCLLSKSYRKNYHSSWNLPGKDWILTTSGGVDLQKKVTPKSELLECTKLWTSFINFHVFIYIYVYSIYIYIVYSIYICIEFPLMADFRSSVSL